VAKHLFVFDVQKEHLILVGFKQDDIGALGC